MKFFFRKDLFFIIIVFFLLVSCDNPLFFNQKSETAVLSASESRKIVPAAPVVRQHLSSKVLLPLNPDTLPTLRFEPSMMEALYEQFKYLLRPDMVVTGSSGITKTELIETVQHLQEMQLNAPEVLLESFDFYQVNTSLKSDRVRITGYYTPVISASRVRSETYNFPLLRRPESGIPNPAAIENGALDESGLVLAWVQSRKEVRNAQLQGSCLVEFPDGERQHLGFGGSVRGRGGSYVFFQKIDNQVLGAGSFPLTAGYSIAVDPRYIPIGSTVLAELPQLDAAGNLKGYTYRVLFAQDRGGAILTTKRIDLYCGVGQKGLQEARKINSYGRLWVMLPKGS